MLIGPMVDEGGSELDEGAAESKGQKPAGDISEAIAEAAFDVLNLDDGLSVVFAEDVLLDDNTIELARIRDIILSSTVNTGRAFDNRKSFLSELKSFSCDYMVGWMRSIGNSSIVRTVIFDVKSGGVIVPFRSMAFNARLAPKHVGKVLGVRLDQYFNELSRANRAPLAKFFVGCFSFRNSTDQNTKRAQSALRDAAAQILTAISIDTQYNQIVTPNLCSDSALSRPAHGDFQLGGDIEAGEKGIELVPSIKVYSDSQIEIQLEPLAYQWSNLSDVFPALLNEGKCAILAFSKIANFDETSRKFSAKDLKQQIAEIELAYGQNDFKAGMAKAYLLIGASYDGAEKNPDKGGKIGAGRYELGNGLVEMKEFALASWQLSLALENARATLPTYLLAQAYEKRGRAYAGMNDTDHAIKDYQLALGYYTGEKKVEDQSRVRKLMADVRLLSGDYSRAQANLNQDPHSDSATAYKSARVKELQGNLDGAILSYKEALRLDPNSDVARRGLARALGMAGEAAFLADDFRTANDELSASLKYGENNIRFRYLYGLVASKINNPSEAIAQYSKILEENRDIPFQYIESTWLNLIEQDILVGRYNDAISSANKAIGSALAKVPDSRLLASYLRFVAVSVSSSANGVATLKSSEAYKSLEADRESFQRGSSGGLSLNWDNAPIKAYYSNVFGGTAENAELKQFLDSVTDAVFNQ